MNWIDVVSVDGACLKINHAAVIVLTECGHFYIFSFILNHHCNDHDDFGFYDPARSVSWQGNQRIDILGVYFDEWSPYKALLHY